MAEIMQSPGVSLAEIDRSNYVASTSTSVIGMVGGARRGPTTPTLVTGQLDFIKKFGKPSPLEYGAYSALEALTEVSQLYYQRVYAKSSKATTGVAGEDKVLYTATYAGSEYNDYQLTTNYVDDNDFSLTVSKPASTRVARDAFNTGGENATFVVDESAKLIGFSGTVEYYEESSYLPTEGNYVGLQFKAPAVLDDLSKLSIVVTSSEGEYLSYKASDFSVSDLTSKVVNIPFKAKVSIPALRYTIVIKWDGIKSVTYNLVIESTTTLLDESTKIATPTGTSEGVTDPDYVEIESHNNLSIDPTHPNYIISYFKTVKSIVSPTLTSTGTIKNQSLYLANGKDGVAYGTAGGDSDVFSIITKTYDSTLNQCHVYFTEPDFLGFFDMIIYNEDKTEIIETIKSLTVDSNNDQYIDTVVANKSQYIYVTYNPSSSSGTSVSGIEYIITGGRDGIEQLTDYDIIGEGSTGLNAFANPEAINIDILCAPGCTDMGVIKAGVAITTSRADCTFIADVPFGLDPQQAVDWSNGTGQYANEHSALDSSYGVLYAPWGKVADPYSKTDIWLPPTSQICAAIAYSDKVGQPWYAVAGLERGKVSRFKSLEYSATQGERDLMQGNRNIINPIINYAGQGIVIWGQKTMQRQPTALDRFNVRRLMNYLKKVTLEASRRFVFEPNDQHTWDRWVDTITPKLENVKELRGLREYSIEMAPTDEEIDNNTMPGYIWVKPTKVAEFIPISYILVSQGATLGEF